MVRAEGSYSRADMSHVTTPEPPRVMEPFTLQPSEPLPPAAVPSPEGADRIHPRVPFSRKIALTGLSLALLLAVPYAHPALSRLRLLAARAPVAAPMEEAIAAPIAEVTGETSLPGETQDQQNRGKELAAAPVDARSPIAKSKGEDPQPTVARADGMVPKRSIEDPGGHALDTLYEKLARVERKEAGAIARILYYGDSIVGSDFVTGKLRRLLQTRFGDAGHGYALLANAWPGWFHLDVSRKASADWKVSRVIGPFAEDGLYGLGGVSFRAEQPDAWARFATADMDEWGRSVSRFEIEYLAQPGGGDLALIVDEQRTGVLQTAGESVKHAVHRVDVPDGAHSLEVRTIDNRPVRAFGIRMEREVPGVTLSALGVTGARARFLDKSDDAHWGEALRAAQPDLMVLAYGSNETTDGMMYPLVEYEATLRSLMRQIRAALPKASLMLVGPPDMATHAEGTMHTRPTLPVLVKIQRKLAAEEGWAFWDQFMAMGGAGSMWAWIKTGMGSTDMFHPTGQGGNALGNLQYRALLEGFEKYKARAEAPR